MKNTIKLFGIIALVVVMVFTACGGGGNGSGGGGGNGPGGGGGDEGVDFLYGGVPYTGGEIASLEGFVGDIDGFPKADPDKSIGNVGSVSADNRLILNLPANIADINLVDLVGIRYGVLSVVSTNFSTDNFGGTVLISKDSDLAMLMYVNQDVIVDGKNLKQGWNYVTPGSSPGKINALITDLSGWTFEIVEW